MVLGWYYKFMAFYCYSSRGSPAPVVVRFESLLISTGIDLKEASFLWDESDPND